MRLRRRAFCSVATSAVGGKGRPEVRCSPREREPGPERPLPRSPAHTSPPQRQGDKALPAVSAGASLRCCDTQEPQASLGKPPCPRQYSSLTDARTQRLPQALGFRPGRRKRRAGRKELAFRQLPGDVPGPRGTGPAR